MYGLSSLSLFSRVLLSLIFIISGIGKIVAWNITLGYMETYGVPVASAPLLLGLATTIEIMGGMLVLIGYQTRLGAAMLFFYMIPVTLVFHRFWALQGAEMQMQMANFLKNLSIMGGLLIVATYGAGRQSLDWKKQRAELNELSTKEL
jgi:putative oxidoreductase